ncbi:hypothetical protein EPN52_15110 [bacterium]|nr:MAG: hypothetical protein EPN52_15110 [bacterium]
MASIFTIAKEGLMTYPSRPFFIAALIAAFVAPVSLPAQADPLPALDAFSSAWSKVDSYTCKIVTHETKDSSTQDRTYGYEYLKPHFAKISIDSGPGHGGGATWHGGDTVSGHQGGLLRGIHLTVSIHDGRATSLRGDTMDTAAFQYLLDYYRGNDAHATQAAGPAVDGAPTDEIVLTDLDPTKTGGVTRDLLLISTKTHLPVERQRFAGSALVKSEHYIDVALNPGLKESDF